MRIQQVVIAVIKNNKNQFLLTRRIVNDPELKDFYPFVWNLPGGGVEPNESFEQALKREIKEEVFLEIKKLTPFKKIFTHTRGDWQGVFNCFLCQVDEESEIILNDEADQYGWFSFDEVKKLKTLPKTQEIISEALKIYENS